MDDVVSWSADVDDVIKGDLTAAVGYVTPAGGVVVAAVAPCGIGQREAGLLGFTTSLGFGRKLRRIVRDPHVALAYHAREHGFSVSPAFVLAQGIASVDLTPSRQRLEALIPQAERHLGEIARGQIWDRLLREYYQERLFVDIAAHRIAVWQDLDAAGPVQVTGPAWPGFPGPQTPPGGGTGPRADVAKAARQISRLPHRLLGYRGADGFPVIVPVAVAGHDETGLRLVAAAGLLPPGGRRAGLLAHAYRPQLVGLGSRMFTGWLAVSGDTAVYAPHTSRGFTAPPSKSLLLVANGLLAKYGMWRARRQDLAGQLAREAAARGSEGRPRGVPLGAGRNSAAGR